MKLPQTTHDLDKLLYEQFASKMRQTGSPKTGSLFISKKEIDLLWLENRERIVQEYIEQMVELE